MSRASACFFQGKAHPTDRDGRQQGCPSTLRSAECCLMQKCKMKSSTEETKFRNPALTLAFASSGERAHLPREGSMQTQTYSACLDGSGFGRNTSPSPSAQAFIRASRHSYEARKRSSGRHVSALSPAQADVLARGGRICLLELLDHHRIHGRLPFTIRQVAR